MRHELRTAFGQLRHRRFDSLLIVLLVAIAVGLSTTSFVVLEKVVLRPLPYEDADRVVHLWCVAEAWGVEEYPFSWLNYLDYREGATSFTGIAASRRSSYTVQLGDLPRSIPAAKVTPNFLEVLGVEPVLGSDFRAGESPGSPEREDVVLVGHRLWLEELGGDPGVVGSVLSLEGVPHTVIGVLPPVLRYPATDTQLLVPYVPRGLEEKRSFHFLRLIARLAPGVEPATAQAEIQSIAARLAEDYPDATGALGARLLPLKDQLVGSSRRSLAGIYGAVQLLFLIACGNVAGVLLVGGVARRRELAVRLALGATRAGLARHLWIENLVLMALGGVVGVGMAWGTVGWLSRLDSTLLPRAYELRLDASATMYTLLVTLGAVALSGGIPGWMAARSGGLRTARGSAQAGALRAQRLLVTAQVAVTLLLLFGGAMLGRSVYLLAQVDPGFETEAAVSARIALPPTDYPDPAAQRDFARRAIADLEQLPGVEAVGALSREPFSAGNASLTAFRPDQEDDSDLPNANYRVVSPGLFTALGVELLAGRDFRWSDTRGDEAQDSRRVVILDQRLAELLWPDRPPLGQTLRLGALPVEWEVVGLVPPLRLLDLDSEAGYSVFVPIDQNEFLGAFGTPSFVVRGAVPPPSMIEPVRTTLQEIDPRQAVLEVRAFTSAVDQWLGSRRTVAGLVRVVAALALILAVVGLYATLSFMVGQRRGELAVMAALGAAPARLLRSSIAGGLRPALVGAGIGLVGCWLLGRWLTAELFGVEQLGVSTLLRTTALLLGAALFSALGPSWRAAREDPAQVLRRTL